LISRALAMIDRRGDAKGGKVKWLMIGLMLVVAVSSQNILPIHIAFIPLLVPPLLYVLTRLRIDRQPRWRLQAQQGVIAGLGQVVPVQHQLMVEFQQRWRALLEMFQIIIATVEQGIEEEKTALYAILYIVRDIAPGRSGRGGLQRGMEVGRLAACHGCTPVK